MKAKLIYLQYEKSHCSVTLIFLSYRNILTYLLMLLPSVCLSICLSQVGDLL